MKLSNKILLGFFGFIFLYLTAVFAEIRLTGTSNVMNDENSVAETVVLSDITYLMLSNLDRQVHVIGSDSSRLEVRSLSGGMMAKLKYKISGDTLRLSSFQSAGNKTVKISVFVSKTNFKGVSVNGADVVLERLNQEFLSLSENAGRVWMAGNQISRINLDLSNQSFLDITGTRIDTLSANIQASEAYISPPVGFLYASLKNRAFMQLNKIQEIQLKKDENSRLNIYQ